MISTSLQLPEHALPWQTCCIITSATHSTCDWEVTAQAAWQGAALDVRIKWPNDLYAGGLKLGGVLCHSVYRAHVFATVTGVGLNLANREPTTCVDALIAARHAELALPGTAAPVPREVRLPACQRPSGARVGVLTACVDALIAARHAEPALPGGAAPVPREVVKPRAHVSHCACSLTGRPFSLVLPAGRGEGTMHNCLMICLDGAAASLSEAASDAGMACPCSSS